MSERTTDSYNTLELLPLISYNVISYLIDNNEMIWKLLKYGGADAWNQADLTKAEKRALIYAGQSDMENYRVFMDSGQDNSWVEQACILRVPVLEVYPTNRIVANATIGFEVYVNSRMSTLSNYQTRADTVVQQLVKTLNEAEIGGLGKLFFDASANSRCKILTIGRVPYVGKGLVMANWVT